LDEDRDVFPDKGTERRILSLVIKCQSEGCQWTGELRDKETHISSCIYTSISCTNENCEVRVAKKDLEEHVTMSCLWRTVQCDYCHELHPQCQMEDDYEKCKRFPMICPGGCMALTSREMIENHTENYCPKTVIPCPYVQMGCKTKVQREKLETHIQSDTGPHIKLVCLELTKTQEQLTQRTEELKSVKDRVNALQNDHEQRVQTLQEEMSVERKQLEEKIKQQEERGKTLEKEVVILKRQEERVKALQEEVAVVWGILEEKTNRLEKEHAALEVKFSAFQNHQEKWRKTQEEGVNVFQNEQNERVRNLQEEVNILRRRLERANEWNFWKTIICVNSVCAVAAITFIAVSKK